LWLDDPADWKRLERAALDRIRGDEDNTDDEDTAPLEERVAAWWYREVCRARSGAADVTAPTSRTYLCALESRDHNDCCHT
jgi:hypothetical protein